MTTETKMMAYNSRKMDLGMMYLLLFFFGWSYGSFGRWLEQILYYFTCAGFGLWLIYVAVTLPSKVRRYNRDLAVEIGFTDEELKAMGLSF